MISPERFYAPEASPGDEAKRRIWRNVKKGLKHPKRVLPLINDRRSFLLGMAASLIVYFTAVGIISTLRVSFENSRPHPIRLDQAYMNAIREFEKVIPRTASAGGEYLSARQDQLVTLDAAIETLWKEADRGDLSPLKQLRLRQLYGIKLQSLQSMIENGDISL